jgi:hypothetical protein
MSEQTPREVLEHWLAEGNWVKEVDGPPGIREAIRALLTENATAYRDLSALKTANLGLGVALAEQAVLIRRAEAERDRLRVEPIQAEKFVRLLVEKGRDYDPSDYAEVLSDPEFWATDYAHAYDKLCDVMAIEEARTKAEAERDELRAEVARLKARLEHLDKMVDAGGVVANAQATARAEKAEAALKEFEAALVSGLERGGPNVRVSVSDLLAGLRALRTREAKP